VVQHLTVARMAESLNLAWNTANDAILAEGKRALIDDTTRFDGVTAIGAGEHVWRHARRGGKYVTVTWLSQRPKDWRDGIEVVAMDGFTGFKTATTEELPDAVTVMDPFHVVRLAATPWIGAGDGSSRSPTATEAAKTTPSTGPGGPCTPVPTCLPASRRTACSHCSRPMSTSRSRRPGPSTSR
jgi:hypothetical protein